MWEFYETQDILYKWQQVLQPKGPIQSAYVRLCPHDKNNKHMVNVVEQSRFG